ncbi:MAG: Lrp/AsnC family transcriptional regulator [Thermomicrobiales bacterium]
MTTESTIVLDELDRALIALLQEDARASYHELGTVLGVSPSTARRRTERLIDADVIKTVVVPNWPKLGYSFVALVGISVQLLKLREVGRGLISMDEVNWVAMTTGAFDLFAQIVLPRNQDITSFITERLAPIDGIRNVETLMVPEFVKSFEEYRLPLEPNPLYVRTCQKQDPGPNGRVPRE